MIVPTRVLTILVLNLTPLAGVAAQAMVPEPPPTRQVRQEDTYFGTVVSDPYRWLEDDRSQETADWVAAQNSVTFEYLSRLPLREPLRQRLTTLWNYARYAAPFVRAGRYFYFKNDGLQNQSVLYVQESLNGEPRVLVDPNTLSADGTVALTVTSPSPDGRLLAYGTSASGSDWQELRVRDVATGRDLDDHLSWIKFSDAAWTRDGQGFFYSRYAEPVQGQELTAQNKHHRVYYHRIGTQQSSDRLVFETPDQPEWYLFSDVTFDGRYLVVYASLGTDPRNGLYLADLGDPLRPDVAAPVRPFLAIGEAAYTVVGNDGPVFYVLTDKDAPRSRLVAIDATSPKTPWKELIPESRDKLESVSMVNQQFVAQYLQDASSRLKLFAVDGKPGHDIELPGIGTVVSVTGQRTDRESFYAFTSFLYPTTVFRYDFAAQASRVFKAPKVDFDPSQYETRQVFYTSRDGTRVPMFITMKKGLALDGSNPTLLYAYGGFDISITPAFSVGRLVWLERGGVYAVANLRGGGEYGEEWHQAGMLDRKQNVFDDFIAAAEYLIDQRYTSPSRLAIQGGSNGGLLVGAVMTQRPELFAVALPAVGVMDMLRFHKFTVGWGWVPEYGSADSSAVQFDYLRKYSPLHNLKPGTDYPATLVTTADHDDRVVPAHSFKFAAALQAANTGRRPTLIRIETKAGHGAGKPTSKIIEEQADILAFTLANMEPGQVP